jgi:hypothetical protein
MARSIALAGLAIAALSFTAPVAAQVTEAGADKLRADIAEALDALVGQSLGMIEITAPVAVTVAGDHYDVTVPPWTMHAAGATFTGARAAVTPTADGWFTVAPALTSPVFAPVPGGPATSLTFERQAGTLTYAPAYRSPMAADLSLEGIGIATPEGVSARVDTLDVNVVSKALGADRFDQVSGFVADGLAFESADGRWSIARIAADFSGGGVDFGAYGAMSDASDALIAEHAEQAMLAPLEVYGELWTLFADFPPLFDDVRIVYTVDDVAGRVTEAKFAVESVVAGMTFDGVTTGRSRLVLSLDYDGLAIAPVPPSAALVPGDLALQIALVNIPNGDAMAAVRRLREAARGTDLSTALGIVTTEFLPVLLANQGLALEIAIDGHGPAWGFAVDARFHSEAVSPYLIAGSADITIARIDDALAALAKDPDGAEPLQALTMLKMLGREATDEAGEPVRVYELVMSPDGAMTLNGTDLSQLF